MKSEFIRVFVIEMNKTSEERTIPNTLQAMQEIVGGYIEVSRAANGLLIICNEEGRLQGLPENKIIGFVGTVFICREDGEEFASLTDEDMERLKKIIR